MRRIISHSPKETRDLAKKLAKNIKKYKPLKKALVLALEGDLGGGKTTFLQGFARGLKIEEKILSPTFIIMKTYNLQLTTHNFKNFYHIDCYRINKPKEILNLGWKKIISNPQNIAAIEWADRIRKILPRDTVWMKFEFVDKKTRKITFKMTNY